MAAAETARLVASLELQDKNFTRGLKGVERGIGRVDKRLGAFSGFLNRNVGRALDSIAARGVDALAGTIEQASNLNEEITKSDAVFGKSAAAIQAWSATTASALGISQVEALAAAGAYGNMFKTIGLGDKPAADMSKRLVELAADMASFNNQDPEEVLLKLRSGLAGEAEPLRTLGVLLSEARVKEEAYSSGIAKRGKKLTEAQKVQARYNLILKDTAIQQGDVEKTGGNLAGQQRKLNALMADAGATIGTQLLPVVTELTTAFVDLLKDPATQKGLKAFATDLGEGAKSLVSSLKTVDWKGFANALGTAAGFARDLVTAFLGLPSWVQAAVISGWGLNKITGGLIGDLASGLIKGVLGINAGIVNVNGPVAGMGGTPVPGGGGNKLFNLLKTGITVGIAAGSIAALAQAFIDFQTTVTTAQQELLEDVNATSEQGFEATIANLDAINAGIKNMNPLQNILAGIFGGSEIVKNYEMAADRIVAQLEAGELDRDEITQAIIALQGVLETNPALEVPGVESAIERLITAYNKGPTTGPTKPETKPRVSGVGDRPSPGNPGFAKTKAGLDEIARKQALTRDTLVQTNVALSGVKTGITTMDANQKAALIAQTAVNVAGNVSAVVQSASQVLAATGTTNAARTAGVNTASASRSAGFTVAGAMSAAASRIVAAVWAARPVIQPTNVIEKYTTIVRGGNPSDSRNSGPLE